MPVQSSSPGNFLTRQIGLQKAWIYNAVAPTGYSRNSVAPGVKESLWYVKQGAVYSENKNYIFKTGVQNFVKNPISSQLSNSLEFVNPWNTGTQSDFYFYVTHSSATYPYGSGVSPYSTIPTSTDETTLIHMATPPSETSTTFRNILKSRLFNTGYQSPRIKNVDLEETDWFFQGYSWATTNKPTEDEKYLGWRFSSKTITYNYFTGSDVRYPAPFTTETIPIILFGPVNVTVALPSTFNNYAAKFIDTSELNFELSFRVLNTTNLTEINPPPASAFVDLYMTDALPSKTIFTGVTFSQALKTGQYLGRIKNPGNYNFYNITGNRWLVIVANYPTLNSSSSWRIELSNIKIMGRYSSIDNNEKFKMVTQKKYLNSATVSVLDEDITSRFVVETPTNLTVHSLGNTVFGATGATAGINGFFSSLYGTVSNLVQLNSKVGNGSFRAGIWENGVWNNGWRDDEMVYKFKDVVAALPFNIAITNWRIQISGDSEVISNFQIGDKVAVSNIIAIDINETRNLLKNVLKIIDKNDTDLILEIDLPFPVRRIERDSTNHPILITKNSWLNGVFLNGYFQGVWNDGLFRGYPRITEMYDTHWIDGEFNGGHFYGKKVELQFFDTFFYEGALGLTFGTTKHGLRVGDIIEIDKTDKSINTQYDTTTEVINVLDENSVIVDLTFAASSTNESGLVIKQSSGLIQNFKFTDSNVAPKNSKQSSYLLDIWKFNSWIDVSFSNQSTTNIGRKKQFYNDGTTSLIDYYNKYKLGLGDYTPVNLYGYTTDDVLSSESLFRDIDSNIRRYYKLGTKYTIYQDFLGDISEFNEPFGNFREAGGLDNFLANGWTWSTSGQSITNYSVYTTEINNPPAGTNLILASNSGIASPLTSQINWNNLLATNTLDVAVITDTESQLVTTTPLLFRAATNGKYTLEYRGSHNLSLNFSAVTTNFFTIEVSLKVIKNSVTIFQPIIYTDSVTGISGNYSNTISFEFTQNSFNPLYIELTTGDQIRLDLVAVVKNAVSTGAPTLTRTLTISTGTTQINFISDQPAFKFSRTIDGTFKLEHNKSSIQNFVLNNTNIDIPKERYSIVEFDYLDGPENYVYFPSSGQKFDYHFIDLFNFTNFAEVVGTDLIYGPTHSFPNPKTTNSVGTISVWASGLDYKTTKSQRKTEYFYNRTSLDLGFLSLSYYNQFGMRTLDGLTQSFNFEVDNIKFYEVDMIPFFQYTTEDYVNKSLQIPLQAIAPQIDYDDSGFSFAQSLQFGIDGIIVNQTNQTIQNTSQQPGLIFIQ
jgi:hypothetical protein